MEGDGDKQPVVVANVAEQAPARAPQVAVPEVPMTPPTNAGQDPQAQGQTASAQKKYSERKDSASWVYTHWEPCSPEEDGPKRKYRCMYCKNAVYRHNVTRMRNHLLQCW